MMLFGGVCEEGVMIHEIAVVPSEGGVVIVDVTVDAGKNKMIILFTINVNFISYTLTFSFFKVILMNINHGCFMHTHELSIFKFIKFLIIFIIYAKYLFI